MHPDEVQEIAARVKADIKTPLPPLTDPRPLTFRGGRYLTTLDGLSEAEQRQLVAVGIDGVGEAWPPEQVLEEGREEGLDPLEVWDVFDATDALAYRVFIYGTDNATILRADTIEVVAGMSQGSLEISRKRAPETTDALVDELIAAAQRVPRGDRPRRSSLKFFGT
jgi:hypothetical protein